jgi:hypothetical protein
MAGELIEKAPGKNRWTLLVFLSAGVVAGFATACAARFWPTLFPVLLVLGVGPLFLVAVFSAVTLTRCWSHLGPGWWRIVAGACICTGAYVLALFTFMFVSDSIGAVSAETNRFGIDIWLGLLAAALVASACIELFVYVLTGKWSNPFLVRFAAAGAVCVLVTFLADRTVHHYWTFYGIFLPVGEGLFCQLIGAQICSTPDRSV